MSPSLSIIFVLCIFASVQYAEMRYDKTFREAYDQALKESMAQDDRTYEDEDLDALSERMNSSPSASLHYAKAGLREHNAKRAIHNAPPLAISEELVAQAKAYAEVLAAKGDQELVNDASRASNIGENLFVKCEESLHVATAREATKYWYNEACDPGFDFAKNQFSYPTSHFSQLVWKNSAKFGIAYATRQLKQTFLCTFVVARYSPGGNHPSFFSSNVEQGHFRKSRCPVSKTRMDSGDGRTQEFTESNKREFEAYQKAVSQSN